MAGHYSPYTAPAQEFDERYERYSSPTGYIPTPSATPSPRAPFYPPPNGYPGAAAQTPQRPATRAHFRQVSSGYEAGSFSPRQTISPRYTSGGQYATGDPNFAFPDDERKTHARHSAHPPPHAAAGAHPVTAHPLPPRYAETPAPDGSRRAGHARRSSAAAHPIQRPQTVRPEAGRRPEPLSARRPAAEAAAAAATSARHSKKSHAEPRKATEEDAKRHGIPPGYSLKNWDPSEEPILLLGSVFDSNSLGKWIYDWTVFRDGPNSPFAEVAGDLWLLLIQLSGKTKRACKAVPSVRKAENKEVLEDFIDAGERLTDKLRDLLANCEQPLLEASKKGGKSKLGKGAGVEFINTLFGRDRMLAQTEKFMQSVRLWNFRFDANIEEILKEPTK